MFALMKQPYMYMCVFAELRSHDRVCPGPGGNQLQRWGSAGAAAGASFDGPSAPPSARPEVHLPRSWTDDCLVLRFEPRSLERL